LGRLVSAAWKGVLGMAGGTFRLEHVKQVVDKVSRKAQYPLSDAAALETALGGADAAVALGAEQHKASEVRQIPADFSRSSPRRICSASSRS